MIRARARTVLLDALFVFAGVVVYFGVRGLTAGDPSTAMNHARDLLQLEKRLGLDIEQGVQSALNGLGTLTTLANWIYIWGHWPVIVATLIWLALRHRVAFRRLRDAMVVSGLMGLCVYTTYPVAPPRLSGLGMIDTVAQQSQAYRVLQPPAFVNQYAAMPSLHVGWDMLVGLTLLAASTSLASRCIGVLMPLAMAVATVITANHYILDVLVGAVFGLTGWLIAPYLARRRNRRPAARAEVLMPRARPAPEAVETLDDGAEVIAAKRRDRPPLSEPRCSADDHAARATSAAASVPACPNPNHLPAAFSAET